MRATCDEDGTGWAVSQPVPGTGNIVAGGDVHLGRGAPPPPEHPSAIRCPQCHGLAWAESAECERCRVNILQWHLHQQAQSEHAACRRHGTHLSWGLFAGFIALPLLGKIDPQVTVALTVVLLAVAIRAGSFFKRAKHLAGEWRHWPTAQWARDELARK